MDNIFEEAQAKKLIELSVQIIMDAARAAGPMGAPSGHLYAALLPYGMQLAFYQTIIEQMASAGAIEVIFDAIRIKENQNECAE